MKEVKLSDREQRVLKAMQEGNRAMYFPCMGRFNPNEYYNVEKIGNCTREMRKLVKHGFVEEESKGIRGREISLTEKGKNFQCELKEAGNVWVVEFDWNVEVNKYRGYIKGKTLQMESGGTAKEGNKRKFFNDRNKAFEYAIESQNSNINIAKGKVKWEEEKLKALEEHLKNPSKDNVGYL